MLDYLSRWIQARQIQANKSRGQDSAEHHVRLIKTVVETIPAEIMSRRAAQCKSYSRALFYWEQHIRNARNNKETEGDPMDVDNIKSKKDKKIKYELIKDEDTERLEHLQELYTQIDEPDGIEGISAHLHVLDIEQQILGHRKAGRWTAAQSWYEIKLAEKPDDLEVQINLLTCLKESGQHGQFSEFF